MNPYEHGECYVTDDGETDLDLGLPGKISKYPYLSKQQITTGKIYNDVIQKERAGEFLGKTVQVIPHITDEIKANFYKLGETGLFDFIITEIGGCVGDIELYPSLKQSDKLVLN